MLGIIFSSACAPLLNELRRRLHTKQATFAYVTIGIAIGTLIVVITILSVQIYSLVYGMIENPESISNYSNQVDVLKNSFFNWAQDRGLGTPGLRSQINQAIQTITFHGKSFAVQTAKSVAANAPDALFDIFIFILAFSALLVAGSKFWRAVSRILGLDQIQTHRIDEFERVCALALGSVLLTGLIQTILVLVGCAIAGVGNYLLIFVITFIFCLIPIVGAGTVPTILALFAFVESDSSAGIILVGTALIAGTADNIVRAWLFSRAAKTNPILSLISLLGGIALLGFAGLFVAPILEQLVMKNLLIKRPLAPFGMPPAKDLPK